MNHPFSFLSAIFSDVDAEHTWYNFKVSTKLNKVVEMSLNLVLAAVCIGYITTAVTILFPFVSVYVGYYVALGFLLCALPFEMLDIDRRLDGDGKKALEIFGKVPFLSRLLGLCSTVLGSVQYFIRNYATVLNFTSTSVGKSWVKAAFGNVSRAKNAAVVGGVLAFISHFIVAYRNWEDIIGREGLNPKFYHKAATVLWVGCGICALYFLSLYTTLALLIVSFAVTGEKSESTRCPESWFWPWARVLLPLGAILYTLVDFFNSYKVIAHYKIVSELTITMCIGFGVYSLLTQCLIWGANTIKSMGDNNVNEETQGLFKKIYDYSNNVRLFVSIGKEILLCCLDLSYNGMILADANAALGVLLGAQINLMTLNVCTIFYALNKVVITYFLATIDKTGHDENDSSYKNQGRSESRHPRTPPDEQGSEFHRLSARSNAPAFRYQGNKSRM